MNENTSVDQIDLFRNCLLMDTFATMKDKQTAHDKN